MGWKEVTLMSQRFEFVKLALQEGSNISELCRRFEISRKTGYKFIKRYQAEGADGLINRSRRPKRSPNITKPEIEKKILDLREEHQTWGGRKLKRRLEDTGSTDMPSAGTITQILRRHHQVCDEESARHQAWNRFEAEKPNDLWQMDFKGHFKARDGRCYPLTILDDHSRYSLCIGACRNERTMTVMEQLSTVFAKYGMPYKMLMDNGAPWGNDSQYRYTKLTVWLLRLGIAVSHSRPYHPQTMGKDERFHRTLKAEIINYCQDNTINQCQRRFDDWREVYNTQRPHEALDLNTPIRFFKVSPRTYPAKLPDIEYGPGDIIRKVCEKGLIHFKGEKFKVGKAFFRQPVALRITNEGKYDIFFCYQRIGHIDLTCNKQKFQ